MRLQVNLIPAIAYALVTMFANIAGWTNKVESFQPQHQHISVSASSNELKIWNKNVYVSGKGQIFLSNNFHNNLLVWTIPGTTGILLPFVQAGKKLVCGEQTITCLPS